MRQDLRAAHWGLERVPTLTLSLSVFPYQFMQRAEQSGEMGAGSALSRPTLHYPPLADMILQQRSPQRICDRTSVTEEDRKWPGTEENRLVR